jgi:hypothetical protein
MRVTVPRDDRRMGRGYAKHPIPPAGHRPRKQRTRTWDRSGPSQGREYPRCRPAGTGPRGAARRPARGARNCAASHPPADGPERTARGKDGGYPRPRRRHPLRNGPGYPSGRPGTRWLRVGTKAVVYWASGPFPGHTCRSGGPPPPFPRGRRGPLASRATRHARWTWLPVAACTCGATPHGPAVSTRPRSAPGPTSCGGLGRTYSPLTSNCQHPCDLRAFTKSAGQYQPVRGPRHAAARRGRTVRPHAIAAAHPFGPGYTVRPPTTVRSAVGSSPPGVTSGSPGVPERGSVDQLATRVSGVCTTRSPTLQTA